MVPSKESSGRGPLVDGCFGHKVCCYRRSALVSEVPLNEQTRISRLARAGFQSARAANRSSGDDGCAPTCDSSREAGLGVDAKRGAAAGDCVLQARWFEPGRSHWLEHRAPCVPRPHLLDLFQRRQDWGPLAIRLSSIATTTRAVVRRGSAEFVAAKIRGVAGVPVVDARQQAAAIDRR